MFIQNMTTAEMVREYRADLPELEKFNIRTDNSEYINKQLDKAKKTGKLCFTRQFTTSRNNRYINVFQYTKSKESTRKATKWDWNVYSVALMQTYKGIAAIMFYADASLAITFQQHFFVRYKQRMLEKCDWRVRNELNATKTIEDIMAICFKRNQDIAWINTKSKFQDREHIFAPINDGAILIQWDGEHIQANTFITEDMSSDKQSAMFEQARDAKKEKEESNEAYKALIDLMSQQEPKH
jgi:hypothetical protein